MSSAAPEKALRNPKRGKAHRVRPDWTEHYWSEHSRCGLPTRNMTEVIDLGHADPADRCRTCFKGVVA